MGGILGVFLGSVGIEVITDIQQLHTLTGGASASCGTTPGVFMVERPQSFFYFFFGKASALFFIHNGSSCGGFCVSIAYQKEREKGGIVRPPVSLSQCFSRHKRESS